MENRYEQHLKSLYFLFFDSETTPTNNLSPSKFPKVWESGVFICKTTIDKLSKNIKIVFVQICFRFGHFSAFIYWTKLRAAKIRTVINNFRNTDQISSKIESSLIPDQIKTPTFYLMPKMYKSNNPERPVISSADWGVVSSIC